jgi:ketopantoate reductase
VADVTKYAEIVKRIISEYAAIKPAFGDIVIETIFDDEQGHYEMMYAGWDRHYRIHGAILHVDIRDGKVWIQHDGTDGGITDELLEGGIPYEHIVLAFHYPNKRKHTPFAVS